MSVLHRVQDIAGHGSTLEVIVQSLIVCAERQGAEGGYREQVGHRRDGVVDSGRDARLVRWDDIDHGGGKRRDADDHTDANDRNRAEKGQIRLAAHRQRQQSETESRDCRSDHQQPSGAETIEHAAGPARQHAHNQRERQERGGGERREKSRDLDQRKRGQS